MSIKTEMKESCCGGRNQKPLFSQQKLSFGNNLGTCPLCIALSLNWHDLFLVILHFFQFLHKPL